MARYESLGARGPSPTKGMVAVQTKTGTRSPDEWQEMANNPEAHDEAMRAERRKIMGDANVTEVSLRRAFENIQETYIEVSETNGRRITGARQTTDIRLESRLRQEAAAAQNVGLREVPSTISGAVVSGDLRNLPSRPAPSHNGGARGGSAANRGRRNGSVSSNASQVRAGYTTVARSQQNSIGANGRGWDQMGRGGARSSAQGIRSAVVASPQGRPVPINTQTANRNAATSRARPTRPTNGHANGNGNGGTNCGAFQAVRTTAPQVHEVPATSPEYLQDKNPDSASMVGVMGFDNEMNEAIQGQPMLTRQGQQSQPPSRIQRQRVQPAQAESLINFGDEIVVNGPLLDL